MGQRRGGRQSGRMKYLLVALGGALGSVMRVGFDSALQTLWAQRLAGSRFPFGLLVVNVLGCFVFGLVVGVAGGRKVNVALERQWFLLSGLLGGFTTFSSFSYDSVHLLREGAGGLALLNLVLSLGLGLLATAGGLGLGLWLGPKLRGA
jgi:fluoride exporter